MNYHFGVKFLRDVCKKYDEQGNFGRYYRALDLLAESMNFHVFIKGVEE